MYTLLCSLLTPLTHKNRMWYVRYCCNYLLRSFICHYLIPFSLQCTIFVRSNTAHPFVSADVHLVYFALFFGNHFRHFDHYVFKILCCASLSGVGCWVFYHTIKKFSNSTNWNRTQTPNHLNVIRLHVIWISRFDRKKKMLRWMLLVSPHSLFAIIILLMITIFFYILYSLYFCSVLEEWRLCDTKYNIKNYLVFEWLGCLLVTGYCLRTIT